MPLSLTLLCAQSALNLKRELVSCGSRTVNLHAIWPIAEVSNDKIWTESKRWYSTSTQHPSTQCICIPLPTTTQAVITRNAKSRFQNDIQTMILHFLYNPKSEKNQALCLAGNTAKQATTPNLTPTNNFTSWCSMTSQSRDRFCMPSRTDPYGLFDVLSHARVMQRWCIEPSCWLCC